MTKFEEVSSMLNHSTSADLRENVIYWLDGDKFATVNTTTNSRYASKLRKLAEKFPEDVRIFSETGGVMVAGVRTTFIKISKREGREMTDEHKQKLMDAAREWRESST